MIALVICWLVVVAVANAVPVAEAEHKDDYRLVWEDNFDFFDRTKWDHEITAWGGGNQEFQVYVEDEANYFVKDGNLNLKATLLQDNTNPLTGQPFGEEFMRSGRMDLVELYGRCTQADNGGCVREGRNGDIPPMASTRLRSAGRFSFRYGRAEIRAKMPVGDWMWPAMWLLPENWVYGNWPRSGEIDMVETIGNRDLKFTSTGGPAGVPRMGSALHWGLTSNENRYDRTNEHRDNVTNNYGDYFHTYRLDWNDEGIVLYVDDFETPVLRVPPTPISENPGWSFYQLGQPWNNPEPDLWPTPMAPFDKEMHFLLNIAVGGCNGFIPDEDRAVNRGGEEKYRKPWKNADGYIAAMNKFYNAREGWYETWTEEGENNAMQVDYVRVYERT